MDQENMFLQMKRLSADIRIATLQAIGSAGFGHIGGSASIADVLAVLYGGLMQVDPKEPKWEERDYLVLSKGHCAPALYAALAIKGYFPKEWLETLNKPGTRLPSHADGNLVPGVDMSTGSLGQGISAALGIAVGKKIQGKGNWVYCIVGDGECNEGEVWEACQVASHYGVDHLFLLVDWNKKQLDGRLEDICNPLSLENKFFAFGFDTCTVKGYDVQEIYEAINKAKTVRGKPHCIILDTIKGLGVPFAEEAEFNHYMAFGEEEVRQATEAIERRYREGSYPGGGLTW